MQKSTTPVHWNLEQRKLIYNTITMTESRKESRVSSIRLESSPIIKGI